MQKIILDTNVFISALISPNGIPGKIFDELIIEGTVLICTSEQIITEYIDVLNREKFKKYRNFYTKAEILLGHIEEISAKYTPENVVDKLTDKSDNKFLELAVESKADYLVTGDVNDFNLDDVGITKIVTPSEYWNNFRP